MEKTCKENRLGRLACLLTGGKRPRRNQVLMVALVLAALFTLILPVAATEYSGDYLVTANGTFGRMTGGLYYDEYNATFPFAHDTPFYTNFTLPAVAVNNITWARLEVVTYMGYSTGFRNISVHTKINGGSGTEYDLPEQVMTDSYEWGTKSVRWNGTTASRVSSDFVTWYDVKDYLVSRYIRVNVTDSKPNGDLPDDGRVKAIILIVAYNDDSSGKEYYFWVNQGHDVSAYLSPPEHIGRTAFNTSVIPVIGHANLSALYISSYNGNYTFNGPDSDLKNANQLTWNNPKQGPYFGSTSWGVTCKLNQGSDSFMNYTRNGTASGMYSGYYKIPLGILVVENGTLRYDASSTSDNCCAGSGLVAYEPDVSDLPAPDLSEPTTLFSAAGYTNIATDNGIYEQSSAVSGKYATHRFNFTICPSCGDVTSLTANWAGRGYNDGTGNNGATLYIWNFGYSRYDLLATTDEAGKVYLEGTKDSDLCDNYIDGNQVIILAEQKSATAVSGTSHLDTDYVKLEVHR